MYVDSMSGLLVNNESIVKFLIDEGDIPRSEFKEAITLSDDDLKRLIDNNDDPNTKRATSTWFKRYEK